MLSMSQKFLRFKTRHNLTNSIIVEMMEEYANSGPDLALSHFMKNYNISKHVFYRARDFAVICLLVNNKTMERIFAKSAFNYAEHSTKNSAFKSDAHAAELRQQRQDFFNSFSKQEIKDMLNKYSEGMELNTIAVTYDTSTFAVKNLLRKGILLNYADPLILAAIKQRLAISGKSLSVIYET